MSFTSWKHKYNKKYGFDKNESHSLKDISKKTGVSMKGLQQIYDKGIGAYKTNPSSVRPQVNSKEQWAMARVYSSVMGGKAAKVDAKELEMETGGNVEKYYRGGDIEDFNKWKSIDWDLLPYGKQKKKLFRLLSWLESERLVIEKLPEEKREILQEVKDSMFDSDNLRDLMESHLEDLKWEYDRLKADEDSDPILTQIKELKLTTKDFSGASEELDYKELAEKVVDKVEDEIYFYTVDDYAFERLQRMLDYAEIEDVTELYDDILTNHGEAVYTEEAEQIQYDLFNDSEELTKDDLKGEVEIQIDFLKDLLEDAKEDKNTTLTEELELQIDFLEELEIEELVNGGRIKNINEVVVEFKHEYSPVKLEFYELHPSGDKVQIGYSESKIYFKDLKTLNLHNFTLFDDYRKSGNFHKVVNAIKNQLGKEVFADTLMINSTIHK